MKEHCVIFAPQAPFLSFFCAAPISFLLGPEPAQTLKGGGGGQPAAFFFSQQPFSWRFDPRLGLLRKALIQPGRVELGK